MGTVRRISDKVVDFKDLGEHAKNAWERLGVPSLHPALSHRVATMLSNEGMVETPKSRQFIPFLLSNCDLAAQSRLGSLDFGVIRSSLYGSVLRAKHVQLTNEQKDVLSKLAIFKVRQPTVGSSPPLGAGAAFGTRHHLKVDDDVPIPVHHCTPPLVFVDLRDHETEALTKLIEPVRLRASFDLVRIALNNWEVQPLDIQDSFIDYLVKNWQKFPKDLANMLNNLRFVTVCGNESRVPPRNLIHPGSEIAPLYEGELERIPTGRFSTPLYLVALQNLGFLPSSFTFEIVDDRLQYLSGSISHDTHAFEKAKRFTRMLDRSWNSEFHSSVVRHRTQSWLPLCSPNELIPPNDCRNYHTGENADPFLYDFVFWVLQKDNVNISSPSLRRALGWSDQVPTDVILRQLQTTMALQPSANRNSRLVRLLTYLGRLHGQRKLTSGELEALRFSVKEASWIPVSGASSADTVTTEYALLSEVDLRHPFRRVHMGMESFLIEMGCTAR